ncbi:unnamed protein product [Ascophyllum nodosum]
MVASESTKALCLAGVLGSAAAFMSPCALRRTTGGALGGVPQHRAEVATRSRGLRSRMRMVTKLTGQDKKKGDDLGGVKASVKDRLENKKTDPDKLDDKSFPILDDLAEQEDVNLKVTPNAWKWPPLWPYTPDYFDRPDETEDGKAFAEARMTPCLEGSAREALVSHYARFLTDDSRVLEIGSSVDSYLPEDLSFSEVVGLGMNADEMAANPRLTKRVVQDLNAKWELPYDDDSFDFVVMANTIEFLKNPRFVMREVYRVLRPEGLCMIPFTSQGAYKEYEKKQIKMWKTMNDAQHMWIVGSFFKFSADAGWDNLKGYDMSSGEDNMLTKFVGSSGNQIFVVQAQKAIPPDPSDVGNTIRNRLYGTRSLDTDDVDFVALRLHARYKKAKTDEERAAIMALIDPLVEIYDLLEEMPPGVLFAPYKAILAEALSPNWNGSDEQKAVLREGLGLTPPGKDVWAPLGEATLLLHPEDRVRLLVDLVPLFEGTEDQRQALLEMKNVLPQVSGVLSEKMPRWSLPDTQLMITDLMVTDFLTDKKEGRDSFVEWLRAVDPLQLEVWLDERKTFKARAKDEMERGGLRSASI